MANPHPLETHAIKIFEIDFLSYSAWKWILPFRHFWHEVAWKYPHVAAKHLLREESQRNPLRQWIWNGRCWPSLGLFINYLTLAYSLLAILGPNDGHSGPWKQTEFWKGSLSSKDKPFGEISYDHCHNRTIHITGLFMIVVLIERFTRSWLMIKSFCRLSKRIAVTKIKLVVY